MSCETDTLDRAIIAEEQALAALVTAGYLPVEGIAKLPLRELHQASQFAVVEGEISLPNAFTDIPPHQARLKLMTATRQRENRIELNEKRIVSATQEAIRWYNNTIRDVGGKLRQPFAPIVGAVLFGSLIDPAKQCHEQSDVDCEVLLDMSLGGNVFVKSVFQQMLAEQMTPLLYPRHTRDYKVPVDCTPRNVNHYINTVLDEIRKNGPVAPPFQQVTDPLYNSNLRAYQNAICVIDPKRESQFGFLPNLIAHLPPGISALPFPDPENRPTIEEWEHTSVSLTPEQIATDVEHLLSGQPL